MPTNNTDTTKISDDIFDSDEGDLARLLREDTVNVQNTDIFQADDSTLSRLLGSDIEDEKRKQKQKRTPAEYDAEIILPSLNRGLWLANTLTHMLTGGESGIINAKEHAEVLNIQLGQTLDYKQDYNTLFIQPGGVYIPTHPTYEFKKTPEELEQQKARQDARLHELGAILANSTQKIRKRYQDLGLMDQEVGFWDSQWESIGMNLPFIVVGGGAAKLGLTGVRMFAQAMAIPAFTLMEAGNHFGEIYSQKAERDSNGNIIANTGDLEAAKRSIPFGLLMGSLEFWGVSQAVGLIGKLAKGELKDLGFKVLGKELAKVSLIEGGEEVSQDFIGQTNKIIEGYQKNYDIKQLLTGLLGGAVGGAMLGGFGISTSFKNISDIKKYAEEVPKEIDKLEKLGILPKNEATKLRNLAGEISKSSIEDLTEAVKTINTINEATETAVEEKIKKVLKVIHPPHIEKTATAISKAQGIASGKPLSKSTAKVAILKPVEELQAELKVMKESLARTTDKNKRWSLTTQIQEWESAIAQQVQQNRQLVDAATALELVDGGLDAPKIDNPNILDYTLNYGINQQKSFLSGMNMVEPNKDYLVGAEQASLLGSASPAALHEITEGVKTAVLKDITDRGLAKILAFVPLDEKNLRGDVALGVALNFSDAEWSFVVHNNKQVPQDKLDYIISEAKKLQKESTLEFPALNPTKEMKKRQSITDVQTSAVNTFYLATRQNMGAIRLEIQNLLDIKPETKEDLNITPEGTVAPITIINSSILEDPLYDVDADELAGLGENFSLDEKAPVYHGSPYSYDRFSSEKIGTGEGAQAFGYGLYFSSKEEIGKYYATAVNKNQRLVENSQEEKEAIEDGYIYSGFTHSDGSKTFVKANSRNLYKVKLWEGKQQNLLDWNEDITEAQLKQLYDYAISKDEIWLASKLLQYKDDMNAHGVDVNGELIYSRVMEAMQDNPNTFVNSPRIAQKASNFLREAGIDGIQYLAEGGKGSAYNYVVFDENAITIEEHTLYEKRKASSSEANFPRYGSVISSYTGSTFKEMYDFLVDRVEVDPATKEVMDELAPFLEDKMFTLEEFDKGTRGKTTWSPKTGRSWSRLNPAAEITDRYSIWNTFAHESIHSFLAAFQHSNTQAAKRFNGDIARVMETVRDVLKTKREDMSNPKFQKQWMGTALDLLNFRDNPANRDFFRITLYNKDEKGNYTQEGVDEFVASVLSDTQAIKWLTDRIKVGNKSNVWTKIKKLFNNAFVENGLSTNATRKVWEIVLADKPYITNFNERVRKGLSPTTFNARAMAENNALSKNVTSGLSNQEHIYADHLIEGLEQKQEEDNEENLIENLNIEQFTNFMASLKDQEPPQWREYLRTLGEAPGFTQAMAYEAYLLDIEDINKSTDNLIDAKLLKLYNSYKQNFSNFESFKTAFLKRHWLNVTSKSAKDAIIFRGVRELDLNLGIPVWSPEIHHVKGKYLDGKNNSYDTDKFDILLEAYIPKLEVLLGLPEGTLTMTYVEGFEDVFAGEVTGKTNLQGLSNFTLGQAGKIGDVTGLLADHLWSYSTNRAGDVSYLYIGNFTGKNTLPILSFPTSMKKQIREALEYYEKQYITQAIDAFKEQLEVEDKESRRMGTVASALLEDMYFKSDFNINEKTKLIEVNSKFAKMDYNVVMARRRKWLAAHTGVYIDIEDLTDTFGEREFAGTKIIPEEVIRDEAGNIISTKPGDIVTNAFVFNGEDNGSIVFKYQDGSQEKVTNISIREMLINRLGTNKTDGATFYIIGEFDDLYRHVHAALKSGALKNLYSSLPGDPAAIYIKHAMHGVHKDSMLGQFMIKNNIGLLISDESAKIGGEEIKGNLSEHYDNTKVGEDQILKLKMSQWERMKEEQNNNPFSGNTKQLIGGMSFDDLINPVVQEAAEKLGVDVNDIFLRLVEKAHNRAEEWFGSHNTIEAWADILNEIIVQPQSPQEQSVAAIWVNRLTPSEGQTKEDILAKYEQAFQHPHTAEVLRNRMQQVLKGFLGGKIPGGRVAFTPNTGWGNHKADVDPVLNKYNFGHFLTNFKDTSPKVRQAAFPEVGLKPLVDDLVELSREESRAQTFLHGTELKNKLDEIYNARTDVFAKIKALDSERLRPYFAKGEGISVDECINWGHVTVQSWKDDMIWGTEYKDTDGVIKRRDNGILKQDGSLQKKFSLLDEVTAGELGIKPGDRYIPVVTPLSGAGDLFVSTLAGVIPTTGARKAGDNRIAKFNSELLQSILGKDFDIDTVSIIAFHPEYWDPKDWNDLCNVLDITMDIYPQRMATQIKEILEAKKKIVTDKKGNLIDITADNLYRKETADPIKRALGQVQMGVGPKQHRTIFPGFGKSYFEIDNSYLDNTTKNAVSKNRMQHIWSIIDLKADEVGIGLMGIDGKILTDAEKVDANGKKSTAPMEVNFNARHSKWFATNVANGMDLHNVVDFPKNINKLSYNADPLSPGNRVKSLEHMWGLGTDPTFKSILSQWKGSYKQFNTLAIALNNFGRILFGDAVQLTSGRHGQTYENLSYYQTREQLKVAKYKLDLLDRNDKEGLKQLWEDVQQAELRRYSGIYEKDSNPYKEKVAVIKQQTYFIRSFIDHMTHGDIYKYPPFRAIQLMKPETIPMPGSDFHDHVVKNAQTVEALIAGYPTIQAAYDSIMRHAQQGSLFKVPNDVAGRSAYRIMRLVVKKDEKIGSNPSATVRWYQNKANGQAYFKKITEKLDPGTKQKIANLLEEFTILDAKANKPYEDIQGVSVDNMNIAFAWLVREMDFYNDRGTWEEQKFAPDGFPFEPPSAERQKNSPEYWARQLRLVRSKAVTIMQAFGETYSYKPKIDEKTQKELPPSEAVVLHRKGHEATYPDLFKALFDNPFLFFIKGTENETELIHKTSAEAPGIPVMLIPTGKGELIIKYGTDKANKWTHNVLKEEAKKPGSTAEMVYKLFTERGGLWEGFLDNGNGSYNRYMVSKVIQLGRNIPVDVRRVIFKNMLNTDLYGINSPFGLPDKEAFWISLLSLPSEQGARDNKAQGFLFSKNRYDPENPLQFQSNSIVIDLLNEYEPQMLDDYLAMYGHLSEAPIPSDLDVSGLANEFRGDNIIELSETAPLRSPQGDLKHFLSDFAKELNDITHDTSFLNFHGKMMHSNWEDGIEELRKLANANVMLKALSENGIYYKDLVADIKSLSNPDFYKKYSTVDPTSINLTIERYMGQGLVNQFLRQHIKEGTKASNVKGNIISLFWVLNGITKREMKGNKKLNLARKIARLPIGYDLVALLGEKEVFGLTASSEVVGFVLDPDKGTKDLTAEDVRLSLAVFPTRTFLGQGLSSLAMGKQNQITETLTRYQVGMNSAVDRAEKFVDLLSDPEARKSWRQDHASAIQEDKLIASTDVYIAALLDGIAEKNNINPEVRRKIIFDIAENFRDRYKIELREYRDRKTNELKISYFLNAGKGYTYYRVEELIEGHFKSQSASDKLSLLAAIEFRRLYDIEVPTKIRTFIKYLERSRDELQGNGAFDKAVNLNSIVVKYKDMIEAITAQKGNYMPHIFPIARYKEMWTKDYLQAMIWKTKLLIKKHKDIKKAGGKNYNVTLANMDYIKDSKEIAKIGKIATLKAWDKVSIGWNKGSIIPNFLPRKMQKQEGYTKTDPTSNLNYIVKLVDGMKNDGLRADWWLYQQQAKLAGERSHIIEITRNWYADQVSDHELHTEPIDINNIKRGQQVSFQVPTMVIQPGFMTGTLASANVNGVVKKVTKNEIHLDIDRDKLLFDIRNDLKKYDSILNGLVNQGDFERKPQTRQWIVLQNLINENVVTQADIQEIGELKDFKMTDVANLIVKGLGRKLANPEKIGVFKKSDVWSYDVFGNEQKNKVNRYVHFGMVERLEARARELKNIGLMDGHYENIMQTTQYALYKTGAYGLKYPIRGLKKLTGLTFMGGPSAGKARFNNQMGAMINNIIDAPVYRYFGTLNPFSKNFLKGQASKAKTVWGRINHGNLEFMTPDDQELYKTVIGLGLSEDTGIITIALGNLNINPEEMVTRQGTKEAYTWLSRVWRDALKFDSYKKRIDTLRETINLYQVSDHEPGTGPTMLELQGQLTMLNKEWEAKINGILSSEKSSFTEKEIADAWIKVEALAKEDRKINLSQEQGLTLSMATHMMGTIAWRNFYTGNFGMGFQAKAERLRIPAFFMDYLTAIDCGFPADVAEQLGVNGVGLRHAFYDAPHKQSGANTEAGRLGFQFATYQYNAAAKAIKVIHEAIPQMLKFAYSNPESVSRLKHLGHMLQYLHDSIDTQGKAMKRGETPIKEVNLAHTIWNKVFFTTLQLSVSSGAALYGVNNFADPVGQTFYNMIEFIIDVLQGNLKLTGDDDRDQVIMMINDIMLVYGVGYKMTAQAILSKENLGTTFYKGRAGDTAEFIYRASNDYNRLGYEIFGKTKLFHKPKKDERSFVDIEYLTDQFATGVKWNTWVSGDPKREKYKRTGLYPGFSSSFPFIFKKERRRLRSYGGGQYIETHGKGVGGILNPGRAVWRASLFFRPETWIPFMGKFTYKKRR